MILQESLVKYLRDGFIEVPMALDSDGKDWYLRGDVPAVHGWYFIETNTPIDLIKKQNLKITRYDTKAKKGVAVKHYDLAKRAAIFSEQLKDLFAGEIVYSGIATSLRNRAREHTYANYGTAALSLSNYRDLAKSPYKWTFHYGTLGGFLGDLDITNEQKKMILLLGEQIWRAHNGWPILCSG